MIKKIGILTSGGDSPGMNAAIRAVTRIALKQGIEVYGIHDGFKGLMERNITPIGKRDVSDILDRGGTFLGSARLVEFKNLEVQQQGAAILREFGIDAVVVIGGDGSYQGAMALSRQGIATIGLPGTIDNDIPGTDYTIGFDTALQTVVSSIDKLRDTSASHKRCSVVEVMGNRCGDLAIYAGISCGAEVIITPETGFNEEETLQQIDKFHVEMQKKHAIVVICEKITNAHEFAKKISERTHFSGRATILGHLQRGGSPTPFDRVLASRMGEKAIEVLVAGRSGRCIVIRDNHITDIDIEEALKTDKKSRQNLINTFNQLV